MVRFENDRQFHDWRSANPDAYVVNTRRRPDPDYFVLHRASGSSFEASESYVEGAFTERGYQKWGAAKQEEFLPGMTAAGIGDLSKRCSPCHP